MADQLSFCEVVLRSKKVDDIVFQDSDTTSDDSSPDLANSNDPGVLRVYQTGELTIVGFGGRDVPSEVCIAFYREELFKMVDKFHCKVLGVDLTGVTLIPSGMLGVLTSLRKKVERIELYNPSDDVREVLRMSRLEQLFEIKQASF
jgi:anti-sigma B factor antagonist